MPDAVKTVKEPVTKESLKAALTALGVRSSQIIEVHSSLSSFEYVVGGAGTVVDALMELLEDGGTIIMPAMTSDNSEPSAWTDPPIEPNLYKAVREAIPPYDPVMSDIHTMGAVAENFRHREDVLFSLHPACSYSVWGRYAKLMCNHQSLHFPLAEESPAARLYELKGYVLLIGVDFDKCTCMHLAEYRTDCRPICINGSCIPGDNGPEWKKYLNLNLDNSAFKKIGAVLRKKGMVRETTLGGSRIMFFPAQYAIDEATKYFEKTIVYDFYR